MDKQKIKNVIKKRAGYLIPVLFLAFVIRGFILRKMDIDSIYSHEFNGKITKIKDLQKNDLEIWLDNADASFIIQSFGKYKDVLTVGDSLFKKQKSYVIYYYRRKPDSSFYLYDKFTVYSKLF